MYIKIKRSLLAKCVKKMIICIPLKFKKKSETMTLRICLNWKVDLKE